MDRTIFYLFSIPLLIIFMIFCGYIVRKGLKINSNGGFHIENGYLYPHTQYGRISILKDPDPICIKDIATIRLRQIFQINGAFRTKVTMKDGRSISFAVTGFNPAKERRRLEKELLENGFQGEVY